MEGKQFIIFKVTKDSRGLGALYKTYGNSKSWWGSNLNDNPRGGGMDIFWNDT